MTILPRFKPALLDQVSIFTSYLHRSPNRFPEAGTPYEGGVFKMKLKLGADFPQAPPKGEVIFSLLLY